MTKAEMKAELLKINAQLEAVHGSADDEGEEDIALGIEDVLDKLTEVISNCE